MKFLENAADESLNVLNSNEYLNIFAPIPAHVFLVANRNDLFNLTIVKFGYM